MDHVFPPRTRILLIASVAILTLYALISRDFTQLYPAFFLGGIGILFIRNRATLQTYLAMWKVSPLLKFAVLGYVLVLTEEFLVALLHTVSEGAGVARFSVLLLQFWDFNILAFTGLIFGLFYLLRRFHYSAVDLYLIIGFWGLFSEHTLTVFFRQPIGALLLLLPTLSTYNLIVAPAIASLTTTGERRLKSWIKYPYSLLIFFAFSIIPLVILAALRSHFPGAFPPCAYIACS